jgi:hypothetical protein
VLKLDANTTSCCTSTTGTTAGMDMDTVTTGNVSRPLSIKKKAEKERESMCRNWIDERIDRNWTKAILSSCAWDRSSPSPTGQIETRMRWMFLQPRRALPTQTGCIYTDGNRALIFHRMVALPWWSRIVVKRFKSVPKRTTIWKRGSEYRDRAEPLSATLRLDACSCSG